jgi:flagellar basal body rod protein FlgB
MLRTVCCCVLASAVAAGGLRAADPPAAGDKTTHEHHATLVGVNLDRHTVTFQTEATLPLAQGAKVLGENNKPETLQQFKDALEKEQDKSVMIVADTDGKQILSIRDLPPEQRQHQGTLVSVDVDKNTVTFKSKGKGGKETETTLPLAKDARVLGGDNKPETLQQLKDALEKKQDKRVVVVENPDKQVASLREPPPEPNQHHATLVSVDPDKNTVTFRAVGKDGKEAEMTLPLAKDAKVLGENNKPETLARFKDEVEKEKDKAGLVVEDADGKQIVSIKHLPPEEKKHHATLVRVDLDKNTVTFKTKGKGGKETEMTLPLAQDAKVLGEDNKPETLRQFQEAMEKEQDKGIQIVEDTDEQHIVAIRDLPPEPQRYRAALVAVDLDKNTISFRSEATLPLAKDAKVYGQASKPKTLRKLKEALEKEKDKPALVIEDAAEKHIIAITDLPPDKK